jgi:hypothetical protein
MRNIFTEHPKQLNETYLQHLGFTLKLAGFFVSCTCIILTHGVFPFWFTSTATDKLWWKTRELSKRKYREIMNERTSL